MADIEFDVTSQQYNKLVAGLETLRTFLAPRVQRIRKLEPDQQRWMLRRDPLLRRTCKLSLSLAEMVREAQEMAE